MGLWDAPNKPVFDPDFWRRRLLWAAATGRGTFTAIYDTELETWEHIQSRTGRNLAHHLRHGDNLLDAGCGYGAACECVPDYANYTGVDCSPDLIEVARLRYPGQNFEVADLRSLPYQDGSFRWTLCRSLKKMIVDNLGTEAWGSVQAELLRVSHGLLVMEYEDYCSAVEVIRRGV